MYAKYDWYKLKNEFVAGNWLTVADFFRGQCIKNNSRSRLSARGWLEDRRKYQEEVAFKTRQKVVEDEVAIRYRQQKLSHRLQLKGIKELENLPVRNVDDARKLVVDGMREEREALGMDNRKLKNTNLTQVNVSIPKTNFDALLDNATHEELIELLVAIRAERARRSDKL